jgi:hypothetical protein
MLCLALTFPFSWASIAAELITLTPSSLIFTKGPVTFKIFPQALVPSVSAPTARASIVMLTGTNGVLGLNAQGEITQGEGNFLVCSAYRLMNAGLNVAILSARSSLTDAARLSFGDAMYGGSMHG